MTIHTIGLMLTIILGLGWGSFATMAVYRIPRGIPWIGDKPHCFTCGHELTILDYVAVLSYFLWKGKCRYCGVQYAANISYFATEVAILLLFVLGYLQFGFADIFVLLTLLIVGATIAAVVDAEHQRIPAKILLSLLLIGVIYRTFIDHTFYGLVYGAMVGLLLGLALRYAFFACKGRKDIASDYTRWQDHDRFIGPGFDYVKLLGICGVYLPIYQTVMLTLGIGSLALVWYWASPKTLRLGTLMATALVLAVMYWR